MLPTQPSELTTAWGEWLSTFRWDLWCTLTFREERTSASATRAFHRYTRWIHQDSPGAGWFFAHEMGRLGRLHTHALVGGLAPLVSRRALWKWWFSRYGRAQILPYEHDKSAAFYISKYVTKGKLAHYEIEAPQGPRPSLLRSGDGTSGR